MKTSRLFILAIFCCLISLNASAATSAEINVSAIGVSSALLLVALMGLGVKIASTNLKRVGKHLEDSFGERVLP